MCIFKHDPLSQHALGAVSPRFLSFKLCNRQYLPGDSGCPWEKALLLKLVSLPWGVVDTGAVRRAGDCGLSSHWMPGIAGALFSFC